jgi:hypothetical protein
MKLVPPLPWSNRLVYFFAAASSRESKWFDEGRAQKNSCGGGFGNFKLLFGNVGANLAKD